MFLLILDSESHSRFRTHEDDLTLKSMFRTSCASFPVHVRLLRGELNRRLFSSRRLDQGTDLFWAVGLQQVTDPLDMLQIV